jgi:hypothetical protein
MLPEYTYRQKLYKITLMGNKAGRNVEGLAFLFQNAKYPPSLHRDWRYLVGKAVIIAEWNNLSKNIALAAIKALRSFGASPEIVEFERNVIFDDTIFAADLQRRYGFGESNEAMESKKHTISQAKLTNEIASATILKTQEYALALWAEAEGISEAYRLTLLPSFHEPQITRIYTNVDSFHLVYKVGQLPFPKKTNVNSYKETDLEPHLYKTLTQFMDEHFWTSETWYSWHSYAVFDGTSYFFEGWKNGQYKFLSDHSPKDGTVSEKAFQLFRAIKIHAIGESLGHQSKFIPPVL